MKIQLFTWIFLIPLAVAVFGINLVLVSGQCQSDQQSMLLRLNNSLVYDPSASTKLAKWNLTADCCQWMGVICDQGGRVSSLDLSNESISGGFEDSSALFGLQFLSSLNLSFNNFNTSLPPSFANLTNLMYLNLSSARFVGQIPFQISSMTRLVSLDLSTFAGSASGSLKLENPNLATLVQSLGQLTELVLDGVNISAKGNQWCQDLSSSVLNLQVLSLSRCFLSGAIDPSLAKLHSLSVIRLSNNNLSASVPEFFSNFSKLSTLDLSFCSLTGKVPESLFRIPTLEKLDLSANQLLQGSFPAFLHQNLSLRTLLLSGTSFSGTLPPSIGNLGNLSRMELTSCNFSGPIPNSVANLTQLSYLDLSLNMFTGPIPPLHMSKNLTYVEFSNNQLTGDISSTHWESLLSLVYVNLRNNSFTGNIPSSLLSIPSLQKVWLSSNQFTGTIPAFSNAPSSSLDTLDLSRNKLEGAIPSSIFDLQRLSILSLSFNKFNHSIEVQQIWRLSKLTTLDLSYCNLSINASGSYSNFSSPPSLRSLKLASCSLKEFPDLRNQSQLVNLDLSDNQIVGKIPNWISEVGKGTFLSLNLASNLLVGLEQPLSSLLNLSILDLHNNQLQGNIPLPPPLVTYVDYSSNKFHSTIPINIGASLPFAYFFSLSNNNLTGVIPQSLCNATYLKVLDLSHNNFNGAIPPCLIDGIQKLGVLNLRRNKFEGNVPDIFPGVCKLQTLDLNGNLLVGKVPKSLVNCTMLEVLNLGNNQMEDVFPCILKNISTLRVLVLRGNNFNGGIKCPQHSIWPRLQIIDLASNNFSGPLPSACLETFKAMTGDRNETGGHLSFNPLQLTPLYYQDSITVTSKGVEMEFVKILIVFTSIDFSSNRFNGSVPETIGQFRALLGLNLSHNALTGKMPSSLGNLSQLESLDLSTNELTGPIPQQLASLNFLGYLNLSNNRLVGKIPSGTQIQSFSQASFEGNNGLCGPPLPPCNSASTLSPPPMKQNRSKVFDWQFIVPGLGYGAGAGAVVAPILSCKRVNKWYDDRIDKILLVLLPMLGYTYYTSNDWRNESDEDFTDRKDAHDDHEHEDPHDEEEDGFTGRFCVFCTKVDIMRKRVIHDLKCTCFHSPPISCSSSFSSSSS